MSAFIRKRVQAIAQRVRARPGYYTFLPVVPLILLVAFCTIIRAVNEPRWRAYRDYHKTERAHENRLRTESAQVGAVLQLLRSQETELITGLPDLFPKKTRDRTWPADSFRAMAVAFERLVERLGSMVPPGDLAEHHAQGIQHRLDQVNILLEAARYSDADGHVHLASPEFVNLCRRWQDLESEKWASFRVRPDIRMLDEWNVWRFVYASDPEWLTNGEIPAWKVLWWGHPVRNIAILIFTALLVFTGLRLSFSRRTTFWAPLFCTWSAWLPCLVGLTVFLSYMATYGHVHCDAHSIEDLEIESCLYRATISLGFMGAGMLQLLGTILFWAGHRKYRVAAYASHMRPLHIVHQRRL